MDVENFSNIYFVNFSFIQIVNLIAGLSKKSLLDACHDDNVLLL